MSATDEYVIELPEGGVIPLQSREEMDRWQTLSQRYQDEYGLKKVNDQTNLTTLLVQHISLYRAQQALSGRVPELDEDELPTGRYRMKVLKPAEVRAHQEALNAASKEIREIEKTMGIDKKSREQAGDETLRGWRTAMKARAHEYGLHVSRRVKAYEEFVMELRWRLRLNEVGDAEDKHYEDCTEEGIIRWAREELARLENVDKEFAQETALIMGRAKP